MMAPDFTEKGRVKMYADLTQSGAHSSDHARDEKWPAGWWLIPSLVIGAGIWIMILRALFALLF